LSLPETVLFQKVLNFGRGTPKNPVNTVSQVESGEFMGNLNRRIAPRRDITPLTVSSMSSLENLAKITRGGEIVEASTSGFLLMINREDLVPVALRRNLTLDALIGQKVLLHLPQMNLEISGTITRSKFVGKKGFEVGIDYTEDAPEYWRECLLDLLPVPGELEEN
jgi:hypothetical protein